MTNIIQSPDQHYTNQIEWWMIYDNNTKKIIIDPQQCSGFTSSPHTMAVFDTFEEIQEYIEDENLIFEES
jgi:hypothetical protein